MKKGIIIIISILIVLIILVTCVLVYLNFSKNEKEIPKEDITQIENNESNKKNIPEVTNTPMYFTIKSCIDQYMEYVYNQNTEAILGVLDPNYIKEKNITNQNLYEFIFNNEEKKEVDFDIEKVLVVGDEEDLQTYYVKGYIRDTNGNKEESYLTVNIDLKSMIYSIIPEGKEAFNEE